MAFCSKCGAQLENGVCPSCGAEKEKAVSEVTGKKNAGDAKSKWKIIAGALIVLVVVIVIFLALFAGGPKKQLKSLVKTINKNSYEIEDYLDSVNKIYSDLVMDAFELVGDFDKDIKEDLDDAIADAFEDVYDSLEKKYGKNVKITYEIEETRKAEEDDLEAYEEALNEIAESIADEELSDADELMDNIEDLMDDYKYYIGDSLDDIVTKKNVKKIVKLMESIEKDFGKAKVTAGYIYTIDVRIEGKNDHDKLKDLDIIVLKIDGKWGIEITSLMRFVDDVIDFDAEKIAKKVVTSVVTDMIK